MANIKSAIKRIKQSEKRRVNNKLHRTRARTYIKYARKAIQTGNLDEARTATEEAIRYLDRAAQHGVIHPNNVARRKSRLMRHLNSLQSEAAGQ